MTGAAAIGNVSREEKRGPTTLDDFSGVKIGITQVEYSNTPAGPIVHIFGRDQARKAVHLEVTGFLPYFYAPVAQADGASLPPHATVEKEAEYRSIHGEPLRRIRTVRPGDVRELREKFHHFEADIPFTTRFMIDTGLTGGVAAPGFSPDVREITPAEVTAPARLAIIDIECEDFRGFPEPARDAVIAITAYDSFDDRYTTFLLRPGDEEPDLSCHRPGGLPNGCFSPEKHTIRVFPDERGMFAAFSEYIKETDPDVLSGWNFVDFDLQYILGRMEQLRLPTESLSRLPGQSERNAIRGRAVFDLLEAYKKMQQTQRESYRLDAVAEAELKDTKVRYRGSITTLWKTQPALLVEYNFKDVELCVAINNKIRIIGFYREIARYVGCPLDRTLNSSNVIDIYILRKSHGKFVLPSKGYVAANEFEGAIVFEPSLGVKENVVVLDLKSLYPMAMMTINASPETKDPSGELKAPNGVRFAREPDGLTRSIISELLLERDAKKKKRDQYQFGSREYVMYDLQQNVLKVIMNTYYGVSGYTRFRLYDREIGAAVTSVGRAIIEHTRTIIEGGGHRVIYGDTDSCMVELQPGELDRTIETAREIERAVNGSYGEFARSVLSAEKHYFSIKFEKVYRRFLQAGKKKRYAGHLVWKEGKAVDEIDIVGFEIRRSDYPQITKTVQLKVIEMILYGEPYDDIKRYLGEIIRNYRSGRYSLDEIGIPGGIGKQLTEYETDDAHVRGATYSNKHLGMEFSKGSKPKRVYIKSVKSKYMRTDVLCFEYGDQVPPEFVVDYEMMLDKTLKQPISRIIEALGWDWHDIDPSRTTLSQFGLG
ncbi:MAG: DNA-directed DNA polymerase [Methanoregulaceae archaeon]|nr:DNA-directed DNA polymerase [Methanoregulaceae archaeon]